MLILFITILVCGLPAAAQDPHFSQFFSSPLTLNPASTGNFDGKLRAATNFRNQWQSFGNPYSTATLSLDGRIYRNANDRLSAGLLLLGDRAADGLLKQYYYGASLSYAKSLDENAEHFIIAGFQGVMSEFRFDASLANFEDELSPGGFTLPSGDRVLTGKPGQNYFDMNAGLLYQGSFSQNNLFYAGASLYHLNTPRFYFSDSGSVVNRRYNLHGGFYYGFSETLTLHGSVQYQHQTSNNEFMLGTAISTLLIDKPTNFVEVFAGLWIRNRDALIPYVGLDWNEIRAGFSYDVLLPKQRLDAKRYQSIEFSLIWQLPNQKNIPGVKCPRF